MLSWQIKENKKATPSLLWYTIWFIFGVILIYIGIKQDSPLTIIVFVLILALLILIRQKPSQKLNIKIDKSRISINKKIYGYKNLESFSVSNYYLNLKQKKTFSQDIKIPVIAKKDKIKKYLKKYLKYKKQEESLLDILAEKLGF